MVDPPSGALLEMALNFRSVEDGSLVSVQRLENGSSTFSIRSETKVAEGIVVPDYIRISIPVFENGPTYGLGARFRYRTKPGLVFWYELDRPHKVLEAAFKETWEKIAEETNGVILLGSPG